MLRWDSEIVVVNCAATGAGVRRIVRAGRGRRAGRVARAGALAGVADFVVGAAARAGRGESSGHEQAGA